MCVICFDKCRNETKTSKRVRYYEGEVRCQVCEYNIKTDAVNCYCCNHRYRTKPRFGKKMKQKMLATVVRY
jgi:hypothetical protein